MSDKVIFIPGLMGSKLKTPDGERVWPALLQTARNLLRADLIVDGVFESLNFIIIYKCIIKELKNICTEKKYDFIDFPYDWRVDIEKSADLLLSKIIEFDPADNVHIVAHSMGGLVARLALNRLDQAVIKRVKKVVFIATPHMGAPQAYAHINGDKPLRLLSKNVTLEVSNDKRYISGYQLTPSECMNQIFPFVKFIEIANGLPNKCFKIITCNDIRVNIDSKIENIDVDFVYNIVGINHKTVCAYDMLHPYYTLSYSNDGDGTVPFDNANFMNCDVEFEDSFEVTASHMGILKNSKVISKLYEIFEIKTPPNWMARLKSAFVLSLNDISYYAGDIINVVMIFPRKLNKIKGVLIGFGGELSIDYEGEEIEFFSTEILIPVKFDQGFHQLKFLPLLIEGNLFDGIEFETSYAEDGHFAVVLSEQDGRPDDGMDAPGGGLAVM